MHRIAASPGGWNPDAEGVIFIEQTPAPIIFLTAADTDIQTLAATLPQLPSNFPQLRVANLLNLQQQLTIDTYAQDILKKAQVIILRLLGGRSYWSYGLEVLQETVENTNIQLIILPGDDRPDPDLMSHSTADLSTVNQLWRYLTEGGVNNFLNGLLFIANTCLSQNYQVGSPQTINRVGYYDWNGRKEQILEQKKLDLPKVGVLFYRAHYLSGNLAPIDAICQGLVEQNLEPMPIFASSLREPDIQAEVVSYLNSQGEIQLVLNTTSFSISSQSASLDSLPLFSLDVPVLQVILSGGTVEQWENSFQGLSPRDMAMNVALPEVDGRIISRVISFKAVATWNDALETDVVRYVPVENRVKFVAELAANWVKIRQKRNNKKRIALILANYPNRDGRLANGVGLDTPESCVEILKALQQEGYQIENRPQTGQELIERLTDGVTNEIESRELKPVFYQLPKQEYQSYFNTLPPSVQSQISNRWEHLFDHQEEKVSNLPFQGKSSEKVSNVRCQDREKQLFNPKPVFNPKSKIQNPKSNELNCQNFFPISGIQLGNIFVGIQPARGYDLDPSLNYHAPDLEPTPEYLGFYYWLRYHFQADAIVHIGKHGNLEWLPGKNIGLSETCYPEIALGALPHLYPFIVNDPGEGSQAKRRSQAVIIDHLTPPLTRAELYGALHQLEGLMDEYYEAQNLDPSRLRMIRDRIFNLILQENLDQDLNLDKQSVKQLFKSDPNQVELSVLNSIDRYLCELKEAQIRDGLHIFGQCPEGRQLRDLIVAIARHPDGKRKGLTRAIADDLNLDLDPLTTDFSTPISDTTIFGKKCRTVGDIVEILEEKAAELVEQLIQNADISHLKIGEFTQSELHWIKMQLLPNLKQTKQEITNLLRGLEGKFVKSGSSGAPTRGRADVLPTGRNFYSVDIRAIPTETAWRIGQLAADALIERYTQENGEYPKTLGLSVWGTSTMRTGGDDIAEALALLGVKPIWEGVSRRVIDFEILPLAILGRPRVDVTLRISGFFRDAFPNLINLFDQAVIAVSNLDEPEDQNPLAAQVKQEKNTWIQAGLTPQQAELRSRYRIFGSKPGAYGAGLQGLIEAQNWMKDEDLAQAYINWSSYAYTHTETQGISAAEAFQTRLKQLQIVLHNQDNREHDLLDSDDYYQFQGGMTVAIRALTGKNPQTYFGDNSQPENPKVRQLREEIAKVYRSRVVNPKWLAGVMRHGYKGAFEMAATVDYLFAYDATANCVEDFMYEGVAQAYIIDKNTQQFIQDHNPWALRDMAERLLEANQRHLWKSAPLDLLEQLRAIVNQAEGVIESKINFVG